MAKNYKLILASGSPRRKKILEEMGLEFEVIPSDFEEILDSDGFSYEKIENLAYQKAKSILSKLNGSPQFTAHTSLILGADTVVILDKKILGKPTDKNEAFSMLKRLSGKKHLVVTSICAISNNTKKIISTTSIVEFENLTDDLIKNYIDEFNPLDKAGAYGIQELPGGFIKNIEGSFENVIGLCPQAVEQTLNLFQ